MRLTRWSSSNGAFVKCMLLGQGQEPKPACSYSKSWQLGSPFAHIGAVCSKNVNYSISGAENCSIRLGLNIRKFILTHFQWCKFLL